MDERIAKIQKRKKIKFVTYICIISGCLAQVGRIFLTSLLQDVGNGVLACANEFFYMCTNILFIGAAYGLAKIISLRNKKDLHKKANYAWKSISLVWIILGAIIAVALFFLSRIVSEYVFGTALSGYSLKVYAVGIFLSALWGCASGLFQGSISAIPVAISFLIKEIVGSISGYLLCKGALGFGESVGVILKNEHIAAAYGAAGMALGCVIGVLAAVIFLAVCYFLMREEYITNLKRDTTRKKEKPLKIAQAFVGAFGPFTLTLLFVTGTVLIDSTLYLHMAGRTDIGQALQSLGIYYGKYLVIMELIVCLSCFGAAQLLPMMNRRIHYFKIEPKKGILQMGVHLGLIAVVFCSMSATFLSGPIADMFFSDKSETLQTMFLYGSFLPMVLILLFLSVSIFQAVDKLSISCIAGVVSMGINIVILLVLLQSVGLDIYAVVYAQLLSVLLYSVFNYILIQKRMRFTPFWIRSLVIPLAAAGIAGAVERGIYTACRSLLTNNWSVVIALLIGSFLYWLLLLLLHVVNRSELQKMPFGNALIILGKVTRRF